MRGSTPGARLTLIDHVSSSILLHVRCRHPNETSKGWQRVSIPLALGYQGVEPKFLAPHSQQGGAHCMFHEHPLAVATTLMF